MKTNRFFNNFRKEGRNSQQAKQTSSVMKRKNVTKSTNSFTSVTPKHTLYDYIVAKNEEKATK